MTNINRRRKAAKRQDRIATVCMAVLAVCAAIVVIAPLAFAF
jgi:hypothetical protein